MPRTVSKTRSSCITHDIRCGHEQKRGICGNGWRAPNTSAKQCYGKSEHFDCDPDVCKKKSSGKLLQLGLPAQHASTGRILLSAKVHALEQSAPRHAPNVLALHLSLQAQAATANRLTNTPGEPRSFAGEHGFQCVKIMTAQHIARASS